MSPSRGFRPTGVSAGACGGVWVWVFLLSGGSATADIIKLDDGQTIEGLIISETNDEITVRLDIGTVAFDRANVKSITKTPSLLAELDEERAKIKPRDSEALYRLGVWAEKNKLSTEARNLFREVLAIAPEHKGARTALGFREHEGEWLNEEDYMAATGYVLFQGEWVTRAFADAKRQEALAQLELREQYEREDRIKMLEKEIGRVRTEAKEARNEAERARYEAQNNAGGVWVPAGGFGFGPNRGPNFAGFGAPIVQGQSQVAVDALHRSPFGVSLVLSRPLLEIQAVFGRPPVALLPSVRQCR